VTWVDAVSVGPCPAGQTAVTRRIAIDSGSISGACRPEAASARPVSSMPSNQAGAVKPGSGVPTRTGSTR
jgi:hypothetical protein